MSEDPLHGLHTSEGLAIYWRSYYNHFWLLMNMPLGPNPNPLKLACNLIVWVRKIVEHEFESAGGS